MDELIERTRKLLYPENKNPKTLVLPAWLFDPDAAGWVELKKPKEDKK